MELETLSQTIICPVDQIPNDMRDRTHCKQCGSDLRALVLLGEIKCKLETQPKVQPAPPPIPPSTPRRPRTALISAGAIALLVAGLGWHIWKGPKPPLSVGVRLQANPLTRQLGIQVHSDTAVVKIDGVVPSEVHRQLVIAIAGGEAMVDASGLHIAPAEASPALSYRVRKGDSCWSIAGRIYGDSLMWPKIQEANAKVLNLLPGTVLHLPLIEIR